MLDSESIKLDSVSVSESERLDSEFSLHSALSLPSWRGVDSVGSPLQTKIIMCSVGWCYRNKRGGACGVGGCGGGSSVLGSSGCPKLAKSLQ